MCVNSLCSWSCFPTFSNPLSKLPRCRLLSWRLSGGGSAHPSYLDDDKKFVLSSPHSHFPIVVPLHVVPVLGFEIAGFQKRAYWMLPDSDGLRVPSYGLASYSTAWNAVTVCSYCSPVYIVLHVISETLECVLSSTCDRALVPPCRHPYLFLPSPSFPNLNPLACPHRSPQHAPR